MKVKTVANATHAAYGTNSPAATREIGRIKTISTMTLASSSIASQAAQPIRCRLKNSQLQPTFSIAFKMNAAMISGMRLAYLAPG